MPDAADVAQDYADREMAAAIAALRKPIAIVWRRDGRSSHTVELTTPGRARTNLEQEAKIDLEGNDWAIAYYSSGKIELRGADDLSSEAISALNSYIRGR